MSVNSSSTSNFLYTCASSEVSTYMYYTMSALRILLLLPLSTFVLYFGHQRWRQQHSCKTATHADIFTYQLAVMELIWVLGCFCIFGGTYTKQLAMVLVGQYLCSGPYCGEVFFHILTCVERYLAVVHPITYRGLRNARGVRIRNICIGCVWLLCFVISAVGITFLGLANILSLCLMVFSIIVISFCSLSVLCVLIRPGPGEGVGDKQHVDKSKQKAFYTITVILATVWLWSFWVILSQAMSVSPELSISVRCVVMMCAGVFNFPVILVSPLLYLHRAGKLSCCC